MPNAMLAFNVSNQIPEPNAIGKETGPHTLSEPRFCEKNRKYRKREEISAKEMSFP